MKNEQKKQQVDALWTKVVTTWVLWLAAMVAGGVMLWSQVITGGPLVPLGNSSDGVRVDKTMIAVFEAGLAARRSGGVPVVGRDPFVAQ